MAILGRSRRAKMYHGRIGRPLIHITKSGRKFIMVRAKGGGVHRLYNGSQYQENGRVRRLHL